MKRGFSRTGRHKPLYRPMEQTSTKRINQSETFQLPSEKRASEAGLAVREDLCCSDRSGRITRGIIHDVNNHLSVVINYAYVLARYLKQDSRLSGYVQEMRKAAWRASKLSQQLSASRERKADEPRIQDINFVIRELAPLLRSIVGQSVHLEMKLAADLWLVDIPLVQIEQVLINLAVSGRDRMAGRGTLVIESSKYENKDGYPNRPSEFILGRYVRLGVSISGRQTSIRESNKTVRGLRSQRDLQQLSSVGHSIIAETVKQSNGYFLQLSDDNNETSYTIYFPVFEEKADESGNQPTCLRSSSPG